MNIRKQFQSEMGLNLRDHLGISFSEKKDEQKICKYRNFIAHVKKTTESWLEINWMGVYPGFFTDSLKGATHELNVFSRHTLNIILTYSYLKYFHS